MTDASKTALCEKFIALMCDRSLLPHKDLAEFYAEVKSLETDLAAAREKIAGLHECISSLWEKLTPSERERVNAYGKLKDF